MLHDPVFCCGLKPLKRQTKIAADDILIFYFNLSTKIRLGFFMCILCLAEDSLETSSLIISEKR